MKEDYLSLCENAIRRAEIYFQSCDYAKACKEYSEAAGHMLQFSNEQHGMKRVNAQQLTEKLILKVKAVMEKMEDQQIYQPVVQSVSALPLTPIYSSVSRPAASYSEAEERHNSDNNNSIQSDVRRFQNAGIGKKRTDPESALKFSPVQSPNVHFSDIAGLENVKNSIRMKVIEPILHPELFERFGKVSNGGILLYGPPGTGKTMIARAIATETGLDFYSVRCSDIVGKTFGDGERNLKALFDAARTSGRAMIFFDEFEALACRRGSNSTVMNRIVPELLSQMDGFQQAEGLLIVLASTNRPWDLDSAVLRPPRMAERIYVGLPDFPARHYIVKKAMEPLPKQEMLDYDSIADTLEGCNCADITAFIEKVKEAPIARGLRDGNLEQYISMQDVEDALTRVHSSVQKSDLEAFSKWEASQN